MVVQAQEGKGSRTKLLRAKLKINLGKTLFFSFPPDLFVMDKYRSPEEITVGSPYCADILHYNLKITESYC